MAHEEDEEAVERSTADDEDLDDEKVVPPRAGRDAAAVRRADEVLPGSPIEWCAPTRAAQAQHEPLGFIPSPYSALGAYYLPWHNPGAESHLPSCKRRRRPCRSRVEERRAPRPHPRGSKGPRPLDHASARSP